MKQLKVISFLIAGVVYSNAWSQTFTAQSITDIEAMTQAQTEWADFDGDGMMDLIVAGTNVGGSSKVVVYINEGSNSFNTVSVANWEDTDFDLGDYNVDGYIDILLSGEDASGNKSLKVFKSNAGSSFSAQSFSLASLTRGGVEWFDFDHDGDLDIAATGFDQSGDETLVMYEYDGSSYQLLDTDILPLALGDMMSFDANNDGYIELLITGYDALGNSRSRVYSILADGTSELYTELTKGYALNTIAIEDMNEDGLLDIVLSGASELSTEDSDLYVNNGTSFTRVSSFLQELSSPMSQLADLNNDGYTDLLLSGLNGSDYYTLYYQNDGSPSYSFSSQSHDLESIFEGDVALVDYDADGDQDVFQIGNTGFGYIASLFLSDMSDTQVNDAPNTPVSEAEFGSYADSVWLSWNKSTDDLTDQNSLSYNLYVRTEETGNDWVVSPLSDLSTGYRYENTRGNVGMVTSFKIRGLQEGNYYWGIQTVDASGKGSQFSNQESFAICYDFSIGNDTTVCRYESLPLTVSTTAVDQVNWFSKADGLLKANSASYSHVVDKKDTLIAEVTKTYGCVRYDTLIVSVYDLPSFNLGSDTTICYGETIDFSVTELGIVGLDSTNWYSTQTGSLVTDSQNLSYEVLQKDTLVAEVFNANGCVNYDSLIVSVYDLPDFNLGSDTTICYGETIDFSVTELGIVGLDSTNWYSTQTGSLVTDSQNLSYEVLQKDTLVAEVFNANGCVNYDSLIVSVYDLPDFNLGSDTTICYGESLPLSVSDLGIIGLDSVNWYSTVQGELLLDNVALSYAVYEKDTLVAEVFNVNGCVNYDSLIVSVYDLPDFNLGSDTTICYGERLPLSVSDLGIIGLDSVNWYSTVQGELLLDNVALSYAVYEKDTLVAEVFNVNGCVNYDSLIVSVYELPDFNIGADTSICYGASIMLEAGFGYEEVNWYNHPGGDVLEEDSWFFNYTVEESDILIAEVYDLNRCLNYDTIRIDMDPLPDHTIGDDLQICYGDSVTLSITGGWPSVSWMTGEDQLLHENSSKYKYKVEETLTIRTEVYSDKNCLQKDTVVVESLDLPVFDLPDEEIYCYGDSIRMEVAVGERYEWRKQDNTLLSSDPSWEDVAEGSDQISLYVEDEFTCHFADTMMLTVNPLPDFEIEGGNEMCYGDSTDLEVNYPLLDSIYWYDESTGVGENDAQLRYSSTDDQWLYADLTDMNQCLNTDSLLIVVHDRPQALAGSDSLICFGTEIALGESQTEVGWEYEWSPSATLSDAFSAQPLASPQEDTEYYLEVVNAEGCNARDTVQIRVNPEINVLAGEDLAICWGDQATLGAEVTANGSLFGYEYQWSSTEAIANPEVSNPVIQPDSTAMYYLEVLSAYCPPEYDTVEVVVNYAPEIIVSDQQSVGAAETVTLEATGGVDYLWWPEESLDDPTLQRPEASPLETTLYTVSVIDENGCESIGEVNVLVQNVLFIPNLFTPNGDQSNDTFMVFGSGIASIDFQVFDLQGNLLYRTSDILQATEIGWDGSYRGQEMPSGTYVWSLHGHFHNGTLLKFEGNTKGTIKLLR